MVDLREQLLQDLKPKITLGNRVTRHGFACGLIEKKTTGLDEPMTRSVTIRMYGSCLVVQTYRSVGSVRGQFNASTLKEAREMFRTKAKEYGLWKYPTLIT